MTTSKIQPIRWSIPSHPLNHRYKRFCTMLISVGQGKTGHSGLSKVSRYLPSPSSPPFTFHLPPFTSRHLPVTSPPLPPLYLCLPFISFVSLTFTYLYSPSLTFPDLPSPPFTSPAHPPFCHLHLTSPPFASPFPSFASSSLYFP